MKENELRQHLEHLGYTFTIIENNNVYAFTKENNITFSNIRIHKDNDIYIIKHYLTIFDPTVNDNSFSIDNYLDTIKVDYHNHMFAVKLAGMLNYEKI